MLVAAPMDALKLCDGLENSAGRKYSVHCNRRHLRSNNSSVKKSISQKSVPLLDSAPPFRTPIGLPLSAPSTTSGPSSKTDLAQGLSDKREFQLGRASSLPLETNLFASPLNNANQRLGGDKKERHFIKVKKSALILTVNIHGLKIKTLNAGKKSLKNLLDLQHAGCKSDTMRHKSVHVFTGLHFQYV